MLSSRDGYNLREFPLIRQATIDLLDAAHRKHMIHALVEADITSARNKIREIRKNSGRYVSFTGYMIHSVASVVACHPLVHAYRNRSNKLILFDEVDVSTTMERKVDGMNEVVPGIIRAANMKSIQDISEEIRREKSGELKEADVYRGIRRYLTFPVFLRRLGFRLLDRSPFMMKQRAGTIMVTSVGMFGKGTGWGIPIASHTLNVTIGGIVPRPVLINGKLENRDHVCLTLSFDHDIVDGAPAARFIRDLKRQIE
jgi:pyruvate/2-oxoglutarate dehydrogenase complex dihydrolipoamide acyltransferase (E2) component